MCGENTDDWSVFLLHVVQFVSIARRHYTVITPQNKRASLVLGITCFYWVPTILARVHVVHVVARASSITLL